MDFWEYSHNFDSEDGAFSIDEDITFEASQQELQIELEHFNEMDLEQELHPIKMIISSRRMSTPIRPC